MFTGTVKWISIIRSRLRSYKSGKRRGHIYVHISNVLPYDVLHIGEGDPVRFELRSAF